jgi:Carboxypeptidase regulatory-like domain
VLKLHACITIALTAVALALPSVAQTIATGEIAGAVLDSSGKVVVGAAVLLKSVDTGESRAVSSNASGGYRFTFVRPGTYEISGTSAGLSSDTGKLLVAVGQVQIANLRLKPEEPREVVLVTDAAPLLDTDNANIVYTISTRQLDLLPLPGGDLVGVAYSVPGVVINNRFGTGNFAMSGVGSVSNLFTVNGIDDMDPYFNVNNSGTTGLLLGANEIREASVVQNAYEGQYGRQAGAQVNYVTKSGGNAFHGNLVYNYNGSRLNANDFFRNSTATPNPHAVSNQYAASFGGPVVRDKLFFFADTEGLRTALPASKYAVAIPSAAFEDYSLRTIQPSQIPLYQKMFGLYNNAVGHDRGVPVTNGRGPLQDSTGKLGCGKLTGTPTGTGGIFGFDISCAQAWESVASAQTSEWLLSTRVDYNVTSRQRMFFRFKTDQGFLPATTSDVSSIFNSVSIQPDYEGQLSHTIVITPRLVNNFLASVTYNSYVFGFADLAGAR